MNEGEFGGKNDPGECRGGQGGEMTEDECRHLGNTILIPSYLLNWSNGQVQGKNTNGKTGIRGSRVKEMEKKREIEKGNDAETPVGWISFGSDPSTVFASRKLVIKKKFPKSDPQWQL